MTKKPSPTEIFAEANAMGTANAKTFPPNGANYCGYVAVIIDGRTALANWLIAQNKAKPRTFEPGVSLHISQYGQLMGEALWYAEGFVSILKKYGIKSSIWQHSD